MDISSIIHNIALVLLLYSTHFSLATVDTIGPLQSLTDGETLVSKKGTFEFGFFSPGNSKNRYIGIWYKKIPIQTVVWVANRCNPIPDSSGLFKINSTGNNLVLSNQSNAVAWSTSIIKQAKKPILQLLDNGNLVLRDEEDVDLEANFIWQSFDYPSDTLLSGMKLGWNMKKGLNRKLSAWKSWDDPCPGDLSLGYEAIRSDKIPEAIIFKGKKIFYRIGPWNGVGASGVPKLKNNQLFTSHFYDNDEEAYYMYNLKNESVISIMIINQTTTSHRRVTWVAEDQEWRVYSSEPRDYCDNYGRCGGNANCVTTEAKICQCLRGFEPKSPGKWNSADWSDGCVRNHQLHCEEKRKDGFVKLVGLKVPDTGDSWWNKSMSIKECKEKCLRDCSCTAYSNSDIRGKGSGCIIWFGDLIDLRKSHWSVGLNIYVRVSASELLKANHKTRAKVFVAIAVILPMMFVLGAIYFFKKSSKEIKIESGENITVETEEDTKLPLFDLSTIRGATCNFSLSNKLGQGGYGPVYKGKLEDGQEIAVKRLCMDSGQGLDEFKNEVILIAKLQHRNLVKLLGYCIEGEEKLLIYEYMSNKSLDFLLFDKIRCKLIKWPRRFGIICGIARGLQYLHQDSRLRIVHRDLKASNILLDSEMNPKISDFGMARTFGGDQTEGNTNRVVGTYGYMAPEYANNGLFSTKSDVFSFGIMVLEIISGKRSRGFQPQVNGNTLAGHAWTLKKEGRAYDLVDKCLRVHSSDNNLFEEVSRCIHIGLLCVQLRASDRPTMASVIVMLGSEKLLPEPKQPGYFMEEDIIDIFSCGPESSSTNEMTITSLDAR